jgi:hypothetical protein
MEGRGCGLANAEVVGSAQTKEDVSLARNHLKVRRKPKVHRISNSYLIRN